METNKNYRDKATNFFSIVTNDSWSRPETPYSHKVNAPVFFYILRISADIILFLIRENNDGFIG